MNKQEIIERLQAFDMKQSGANAPANIKIENIVAGLPRVLIDREAI